MTSLFFIMLTLFVLAMVLMHKKMEVTEMELKKIRAMQESTKELDKKGGYFEYNEAYKKYTLRINVFFPELQTDFSYLSDETKWYLNAAGDEIIAFLKRHRDIQYLLIIEGQASMNSTYWMDKNYQLSFDRAKNLMKFWIMERGKRFGENCEIQIAGSGDGRLNVNSMRDSDNVKNQRFLIYIIPKNIIRDEQM